MYSSISKLVLEAITNGSVTISSPVIKSILVISATFTKIGRGTRGQDRLKVHDHKELFYYSRREDFSDLSEKEEKPSLI